LNKNHMTPQLHTMAAMHIHWKCVINVSEVCFCILIYPKFKLKVTTHVLI